LHAFPDHLWTNGGSIHRPISCRLRDATAARSPEAMHAAVNIDAPTYAHEIPTTAELIAAIKATPATAAA
jgi:hypothetical protein